jgi:hypothetical protein
MKAQLTDEERAVVNADQRTEAQVATSWAAFKFAVLGAISAPHPTAKRNSPCVRNCGRLLSLYDLRGKRS